MDPVGDGLNWYAYVNNNPLWHTDPTGLSCDDGGDECEESPEVNYESTDTDGLDYGEMPVGELGFRLVGNLITSAGQVAVNGARAVGNGIRNGANWVAGQAGKVTNRLFGGAQGTSNVGFKAAAQTIEGRTFQLFGNNAAVKWANPGVVSRVNTDMSGGLEAAQQMFNQYAKGNKVVVSEKGFQQIMDASGKLLMQLRVVEQKINLDVWINGVYEDIHFLP